MIIDLETIADDARILARYVDEMRRLHNERAITKTSPIDDLSASETKKRSN